MSSTNLEDKEKIMQCVKELEEVADRLFKIQSTLMSINYDFIDGESPDDFHGRHRNKK